MRALELVGVVFVVSATLWFCWTMGALLMSYWTFTRFMTVP